jgi:hypothetical protein
MFTLQFVFILFFSCQYITVQIIRSRGYFGSYEQKINVND